MRRATAVLTLLGLAALPAVGQDTPAAPAQSGGSSTPGATRALVIFAAASVTEALEAVDAAFTQHTGVAVKASYAASSVLARQIEAGAAADAFLSADEPWMDYLQTRGLLAAGTRANLLGNTLVLIAPADSATRLAIAPHFGLAQALGTGRLAVADPDSVPAGRYAMAALRSLQVWDDVKEHLVRGENVRAALAYVARGEAPLGIVYSTDARSQPRVKVLASFPGDSHPPIVYPVALTNGAQPASAQWLQFVRGDEAWRIFARYGFSRPPRD
ncbi:MAG: molybdate ABC transporter substrate-binding protein [Proteobacteria bacterium]|nr:molybdate ABC transporter substrate-binding protein [Pseudomonadota bacterium]